jgi:hypothetical protein
MYAMPFTNNNINSIFLKNYAEKFIIEWKTYINIMINGIKARKNCKQIKNINRV